VKLTVEQVKAVFSGREPSVGGYGSTWEYTEHEDGVVLKLVAEWLPRSERPQVLITNLYGDTVLFRGLQYGDKYKAEVQSESVEDLCNWFREYGC